MNKIPWQKIRGLTLRKILRKLLFPLMKYAVPILSPIWVYFFKFIADSGVGTNVCLEHGYLPMPVHYYSPVPDLADLRSRRIWERKSELTGIAFQPDRQVQFLRELGKKVGDECKWPSSPTDNPYDFYTENGCFSFGCAAIVYSILRTYKPRKVIEIGSGNSSLVISSALARNASESAPSEYCIIDPYPSQKTEKGLSGSPRLIKERVELLDPSFFDQLGENDVLFIDSAHTVRTGGDVNFLYLDVLPRLASGVFVHSHDIPIPYEYPEIYFTNPSFRMFWTESYLLQAFLCLNTQYEIMLAMSHIMTNEKDEFRKAFPHYDPEEHKATSGSFWIRRSSQ